MKMTMQDIITKLEGLFDKFNKHYYNGELQRPVITVSPDMNLNAYGWCTSWKAWKEGEVDGYYEINISSEYLSRPIQQVTGTLLHEMVHLWNLQQGVQDVSRGGSYHNKKFKEEAEKRGLIIDKDEKYGWTKTSLNIETEEMLRGEDNFTLYRSRDGKPEKKTKSKSSSKKYVCPSCGMIVRATKEVNVVCGDCEVKLELED